MDQYMPRSRRIVVADSLGLNEAQVKTWFQNRRAKDKRNDKTTNGMHNQRRTTQSTSPPSSTDEFDTQSSTIPSYQQLCETTNNYRNVGF
ncbi:hypothetical protein AB6A40_007955 [Gnathostoma spinigerum]|uniref:Homeobox domain-containing protein n=1 Tax=Gnathostoma spinigerum TaxID=75299 RepID=A0ABD6EN80_9BILA